MDVGIKAVDGDLRRYHMDSGALVGGRGKQSVEEWVDGSMEYASLTKHLQMAPMKIDDSEEKKKTMD